MSGGVTRPPLSVRSPLPSWVGRGVSALHGRARGAPGSVARMTGGLALRRVLRALLVPPRAALGLRSPWGPVPTRYRVPPGQVRARWGQRGPRVCPDGSAPCGWCGSDAGYETETDGWERCLDCGGN